MMFNENVLDHPLFDRQIELEQEMRTAGIKRFRDNLEKAASKGKMADTMAVSRLITSAHENLVKGISEFIEVASSGKAGRRHTAIKFITRLDVDTVANLTARITLDEINRKSNLTKTALTIGQAIENEINARKFDAEMPKAYAKFHEKAKKETLHRRQWSHLLMPARLLGVELEEWTEKEYLLVGMKLVELFQQSTGLIEIENVNNGKHSMYLISPNEATVAWVKEEHKRLEVLFPVFMPTIIPPKPWTTPFDGGYYYPLVRSLKLVKTHNKQYLGELAERDMPEVYSAINALQNTRWAINTSVLEVMQTLFDSNSQMVDLPAVEKDPIPAPLEWFPATGKLKREDMTDEQFEELLDWKARTKAVKVKNANNIRKAAQFYRMLAVAYKFKDEEAIYYPHQLDWRGRAYPLPLYLQPQGSDMQRGLLTFADAAPIHDQVAADWLAIHGAGCFGFDKVSLEERVMWVVAHEDVILACAENPYDNRWWMDADKPWQFLAFCLDWAGFKREGFGYLSSLPVQMDGTCNGLQNFSAMLLDEVGGAAVNLVPADKPQDIYQRVADLVAKRVEDDLNSDDEGTRFLARGWAGKVTRKVCKRPVMTLAYGAKRFGFVNQVEDDTLKPWRETDPVGYPFIAQGEDGKNYDIGYKAAMYMGGLIWSSVGEVVIAARAAMDWLQSAAQVAAKQNLPINWTAPAGLMVQQAYRVPSMKRVDTTFNSTRIQIDYQVGVGKIDSRRQASGISPNWVHSLDASHLMKTINRSVEEGITHFSMIHDSYGTHAANAGALATFLRDEFVQMYAQVDVLAVFKEQLEAQTGEAIPELPPKGNLDLDQVRQSAFFFA